MHRIGERFARNIPPNPIFIHILKISQRQNFYDNEVKDIMWRNCAWHEILSIITSRDKFANYKNPEMFTVVIVVTSTNMIHLCVLQTFLIVCYKFASHTRNSQLSQLPLFQYTNKYWLLAGQAWYLHSLHSALHCLLVPTPVPVLSRLRTKYWIWSRSMALTMAVSDRRLRGTCPCWKKQNPGEVGVGFVPPVTWPGVEPWQGRFVLLCCFWVFCPCVCACHAKLLTLQW